MLEKERCEKIIPKKLSGTKNSHSSFDQLIVDLKEGDTLVITKVDRFVRNTRLKYQKTLYNKLNA
jgi:DNA invertase Pin-like site-specific DNA recombinase